MRAFAATTAASAVRYADAQSVAQTHRISYRNYPRCLPDWLRSLADEAYRKRADRIDGLNTAEQVRERQKWARETFWRLAGGPPERTALNVRTTGNLERERYRVEKLAYESRPGEWISANLYIPKSGASPYPGVLFQLGHSANGKAYDSYQRCCQGLVQLGFVALAFDPMGQGERINYPGPTGVTRLSSVDEEHTRPGRQMLLVGDNATRMQLQDAMRSLDVLASHSLVDKTRLASTGQSGGATLTMMLAAVDDRLAAAAISSANTENFACANFLPPGSTDDAEQDFVGSGPLGFDRWDLLWPFAPRPLLVLTSAKDFFGTYSPNYEANGREEYARLNRTYEALGKSEYLESGETPLPHGLAYDSRLSIYRWLVRWLKDPQQRVDEEPPVKPEEDRDLWVTPSGSVVRDFGSSTPFQTVRAKAASIETPRTAPDVRKLLGMENGAESPHFSILSRVPSRNCEILAVEVATAPNVWVPAWIFAPKQPAETILIFGDPRGRNTYWHEEQLYQKLAERAIVCVPDLRGFGDLRPEYSAGSPAYQGEHEDEENYAWASLILGKTLVGARVTDLLAVVGAARAQFPNASKLAIAAWGHLTVAALCAAYLDPKISVLHLSDHLVSWRSLAETEMYNCPLANFVPDILRHTDLPEIASLLAPRKIVLAGTVDGGGNPVPNELVRKRYPDHHIELRDRQSWDFHTFVYLL
jgi:hypothetical protein